MVFDILKSIGAKLGELEIVTHKEWVTGNKLREKKYPQFGIPVPKAMCFNQSNQLVDVETGETVPNKFENKQYEYIIEDYIFPSRTLVKPVQSNPVRSQLDAIDAFAASDMSKAPEGKFPIADALGKGVGVSSAEQMDNMLKGFPYDRASLGK